MSEARIRVTQVRSGIGGTRRQRATLRSLGLKRLRDSVEAPDRPEIRGMVASVAHLVRVEPASVEEKVEREGDPR